MIGIIQMYRNYMVPILICVSLGLTITIFAGLEFGLRGIIFAVVNLT